MHLHTQLKHFQKITYPDYHGVFKKLASGQNPNILFITCSDSRIVPDLLMNAGPGDLFVIRNAGNLIPAYPASADGVGASIEYAVSALNVTDVVICGHSDCGAMKGVLEPSAVSGLPEVSAWLTHADTSLARAGAHTTDHGKPSLESLIEANVITQIDNLKTHPSVAAALETGSIKIHGWVYHIGSGQVDAYDADSGAFRSVDTGAGDLREEVA